MNIYYTIFSDDIGAFLQKEGREFGVTTGQHELDIYLQHKLSATLGHNPVSGVPPRTKKLHEDL